MTKYKGELFFAHWGTTFFDAHHYLISPEESSKGRLSLCLLCNESHRK